MKKIWILSALIMILVTTYIIQTTYAKYKLIAYGTFEETIGSWVVKINDTNIAKVINENDNSVEETEDENDSENDSIVEENDFVIQDLNYNSNDNVLAGKIAPGLEGHFDIVIDATGCSVAVIYDVTIDFSQMNLSDSIKFTKLTTVKDGTESATGIIRSGESTYTGIISLEDIKSEKTTTLRIYVSWEDDGTGKNDEADSLIGTNKDSEVTIPVTVKASQYMGESIAEYKP